MGRKRDSGKVEEVRGFLEAVEIEGRGRKVFFFFF